MRSSSSANWCAKLDISRSQWRDISSQTCRVMFAIIAVEALKGDPGISSGTRIEFVSISSLAASDEYSHITSVSWLA